MTTDDIAHTAAQQRVLDDLLQWGQPRPEVPAALADDLQRDLEAGIADAVTGIPDGKSLWLSKSALDALVCDGRWIDRQDSTFEVAPRMVAGSLAHRAIELDLASGREVASRDVVRHAWDDLATRNDSYARFMQESDRLAGSAMRHQSEQELLEFRDTFPLLPDWVPVRSEARMRVTLAGGKVILNGIPDLVLGDVRDDRARMLLIDLKTGHRYVERERQDLRFYALLSTIKYRQPPFRWATFYLAEGAWDAEDFSEAALRGVIRRIVDGVGRAVVLNWDTPADDQLELHGGSWCRFCDRKPNCPAAVHDQDD